MRKAAMLVVGGVMLLSSALVAAPAVATPPTSETFLLQRDLSNFADVGWSAQGTFVDSGEWTSDGAAFGNGHITLFTTETGSAGSFRLLFQGLEKLPNHPFSGNWQIIDGTGVYATLHGQGTWTVDVPVPPNTVETFTLTARSISTEVAALGEEMATHGEEPAGSSRASSGPTTVARPRRWPDPEGVPLARDRLGRRGRPAGCTDEPPLDARLHRQQLPRIGV